MDKTPANNTEHAQQKFILAKMLLTKYGALGEFHIHQMEAYTYACTPLSLDSQYDVDTEKKTVTYRIKTVHNFYRKGAEVVPRKKYSIHKLKTATKYKKSVAFAAKILKEWTARLLWDNETNVEVYIDNVKL